MNHTRRVTHPQRKAIFWGLFVVGLLGAAILVGSRNLRHIDAALVGYTFACLFAAFGLGYRYAMWLQRPPTRRYWWRSRASFFRRGHAGRTWALRRPLRWRVPPVMWSTA